MQAAVINGLTEFKPKKQRKNLFCMVLGHKMGECEGLDEENNKFKIEYCRRCFDNYTETLDQESDN